MTKPKLKTFDAPLIEVIALANNPPVHDSANEILSFFWLVVLLKFALNKIAFKNHKTN